MGISVVVLLNELKILREEMEAAWLDYSRLNYDWLAKCIVTVDLAEKTILRLTEGEQRTPPTIGASSRSFGVVKQNSIGTMRPGVDLTASFEEHRTVSDADAKRVLNGTFREWLAGMMDSFSTQLMDGQDPAVTFEVNGIQLQLRLMYVPDEFCREEYQPNEG